MFMLTRRSRKKSETIMPIASKFVSDLMQPVFQRIDVVHYTQMSRILRVAEEYAVRLLSDKFRGSPDKASAIAHALVENYPEHGFILDCSEAKQLGLHTERLPPDIQAAFDLVDFGSFTAIGRLQEVTS